MEKKIKKIKQLHLLPQAPGFSATGVMHSEFETEPFLIFGEFYNDRSVFGPHPHAGVSVMTYLMPDSHGSFLNRDSFGDHSIIEPGGVHVTQTGTGVYHDELPEITGMECHAFQIWINHTEKDRMAEPKAFHMRPGDIPEWNTDNLYLRVIQGEYKNLKSPVELLTKTLLYDVSLKPNSFVEFNTMEMTFIYVVSGEITVDDRAARGRSVITFERDGDKVVISTQAKAANFMLASSTPHHEPIVYGGQFVMTTQQQMQETRIRLQRGEMGVLTDF